MKVDSFTKYFFFVFGFFFSWPFLAFTHDKGWNKFFIFSTFAKCVKNAPNKM